ncbi:hypothetical protein OROHE_002026 [Orobanche hederae]
MADDRTAMGDSLLHELKTSSDLSSIFHSFFSYLRPIFAALDKPGTRSKVSLGKKYGPFLQDALSTLRTRLNGTPKIDSCYASELFKTYTLCITCLDSVPSNKPHSVQILRSEFILCYQNWGRYEDAENEGFSVLEVIGKLLGSESTPGGGILPKLWKDDVDKEVTTLILKVVVRLVNCVSSAPSKNEGSFRRILSIVEEIQESGLIGAHADEKLQRDLLTHLSNCVLFLVKELASFDGVLAHEFCLVTFSEFRRLSINDEMEKFGRRICSLLLELLESDNQPASSQGILTCVLDAMSHEKVVAFPMIRGNATVDFSSAVVIYFNKLADGPQVNLSPIMCLYAIKQSLNCLNLRGGNSKMLKAGKGISIHKVLLKIEDQLRRSTKIHGSYKLSVEDLGSTDKALYFTALKFLCEPISKLINSEHKDILCGLEDVSLPSIEDAFCQFRDVYLAFSLECSDMQRNLYKDNSQAAVAVASAAFTLSFTTKQNAKESIDFVMHFKEADWVHVNRLKFIFSCLDKGIVGTVLHRKDRSKEATESFKLACEAAWKSVLHLCKMLASSQDGCSSDFLEDDIASSVREACAKSAFLLGILHQCGSKKLSEILKRYLQLWSASQSFFAEIPIPIALVKQWVNINCKQVKGLKEAEAEHSVPTISSLMPSSEVSKTRSLLEQELLAYEEEKSLNPKLSETMQTIIKEVLAKDCTAKDRCLQKSRILIANGKESRACGVEGLKDCINYLSKAIATMTDLYDESKEDHWPICFLLAKAYGLRAFCTQEAEPKSEVILKDIEFALKLWSSQHCSQSAESRNNLALLYCVSDLISLKGYKVDHSLIYETMIKFSLLTDVPLEDCVAFLWKFRRLSHALCASSVNDEFIRKLSEHDSLSKSVKFWDSCMKRSESLKVGLWESLRVISTLSSSHSCVHDHATKTDERIDQVKKFASDLLKSVPLSKTSLFLAAQLYYDLAENMIARGSMTEALSSAKEAHRLRNDLFRKMFIYSVEQEHERLVSANGEEIQIRRFVFQTFRMHSSVATSAWTAWSTMKGSSNFDESEPTPSKILQCYLESTLQMGSLEEVINDGSRAEFFLQLGKGISLSQDLPIFLVSFSAALGNLYRKQQLLDLAEKELQSANGILTDRSSLLSCSNCRSVLEVTVAQQLGDLHRSRFTRNKEPNEFSRAEIFYKSAENKLNCDGWKNSLSNPDEASVRNKIVCDALLSDGNARTSRNTRSSSKQRSEHDQNEVQDDKEKQKVDSIAASVRDKVECWHCLPYEVRNSSMETVIQMKWECIRRRLLLRILTGKGKCLGVCGEIRRAQDVFFESMSVLLIRNTFHQSHSLTPTPFTFLATLIEDNVTGDIFSVEHASILYNICRFSLESFNDNDNDTWKHGPVVVSGLKLAFILCREVPFLLKKVSRLLAVLSIHFSSKKAFSMSSSSSNHLCESQWASYFHQVSLGTDFSLRLFSSAGKQKDQKTTDVNGSGLPSVRRYCASLKTTMEVLAPKSVRDLEGFIETFFQGLPHDTIICVSMFGGHFASLLTKLFQYESSTPPAWIMLSRFNSDSVPIVVVLPIDGTLAETSVSSLNKESSSWRCPWGKTIIDEFAPQFREILEDSFISMKSRKAEDPTWQILRRQELDTRLSGFLRDIERLWFGPCKHLLLGEWLDNKHLISLQKKLMQDLRTKCKVDASESVVKLVLGVSQDASQGVEWLSEQQRMLCTQEFWKARQN